MTYGIVADPQTVLSNMKSLTSVMPADAAKLIGGQPMSVQLRPGGVTQTKFASASGCAEVP